jgi:DNA-binding transcriptional ArsR family regulator
MFSYQNAYTSGILLCLLILTPVLAPGTQVSFGWVKKQYAQVRPGNRRAGRCSAIPGQFIAGPVDVAWVLRASKLGVKTLLVGLLLWHLKGLRHSATVLVSNLMAERWGVTPDAKGRALRKLEKAGLIAVERQGKRSPRVTLLVEGQSAGPQTVSPIIIQTGR